ncbi:MAG: YARHG domain-containing protein [Peptostreptococcaceae bacterium]
MKICKHCGNKLNKDDKFCDNCGKISEQPKKIKHKKAIIITLSIVAVLLICGALLYFSKDKLMYSYYLKKGENEASSSVAIENYLKGLKITYTQEIIEKINTETIEDENFEKTLKILKDHLKKEDLDYIQINKYVQTAQEKFENENYEICRIYLNKAISLGYEDSDFKYYTKLRDKEAEIKMEKEKQNMVVNNFYENNSQIQTSYLEYYIIPDSNIRYLSESELLYYTKMDLGYIRNEIFARHGYIFKNEDYRNYFSSMPWYYPNSNFKGEERELNEVERYNVNLIKRLER